MPVTVRIPTILRPYTGGAAEVPLDARTVGEALQALENRCPGVCSRILDNDGKLRRFVNVYVNDEDVRGADNLGTPTPDGASITVIPAVAGGC
jgi:molybdopterin synthase sulfur carrier subunit